MHAYHFHKIYISYLPLGLYLCVNGLTFTNKPHRLSSSSVLSSYITIDGEALSDLIESWM